MWSNYILWSGFQPGNEFFVLSFFIVIIQLIIKSNCFDIKTLACYVKLDWSLFIWPLYLFRKGEQIYYGAVSSNEWKELFTKIKQKTGKTTVLGCFHLSYCTGWRNKSAQFSVSSGRKTRKKMFYYPYWTDRHGSWIMIIPETLRKDKPFILLTFLSGQ